MMIRDKTLDLDRPKTIKVSIPVRYHIRLHSVKLLQGKQISDMMVEALDGYFARSDREDDAALSTGDA